MEVGEPVRSYLLWALSFVKPKIIEKKLGKEDGCPLLSGGKGSLGKVWRLPDTHQPFLLLLLSSVLISGEQALLPDASMDNSSPMRGAHQHF